METMVAHGMSVIMLLLQPAQCYAGRLKKNISCHILQHIFTAGKKIRDKIEQMIRDKDDDSYWTSEWEVVSFYMNSMCTIHEQYQENTWTVQDHVHTTHGLPSTSGHKCLYCTSTITKIPR